MVIISIMIVGHGGRPHHTSLYRLYCVQKSYGIFGEANNGRNENRSSLWGWGVYEVESTDVSPKSIHGFTLNITLGARSYLVKERIDLLVAFVKLAFFGLHLKPQEDEKGQKAYTCFARSWIDDDVKQPSSACIPFSCSRFHRPSHAPPSGMWAKRGSATSSACCKCPLVMVFACQSTRCTWVSQLTLIIFACEEI